MLFRETVGVYCENRTEHTDVYKLSPYLTGNITSPLQSPTGQWCLEKQSLFTVRTVRNTQMYINSVRTSRETHYVSATEPNRSVMFRETVAVYCENRTEHTDTLRGQNVVLGVTLDFKG
jgi:hypothetical protein